MYIRMVWGKLRPGSWEEYERYYHERLVSHQNINGLQERQFLRSTEDSDEGISVNIWEALEQSRSSETCEFRQNVAREVQHLSRGEYWVKHFEVSSTDHEPGRINLLSRRHVAA